MVRHWSPWDSQLLRVLRGEFRLHSPTLTFRPGPEGGVGVYHREMLIGVWIATGRLAFRYVPNDPAVAAAGPCDIMDIIPLNYDLFSRLLDAASRDSA
jgi:hypothetical protein